MDYWVETIKRQTRAVYGCMVVGKSQWAWAWTAQPISCTPALSVTQKHRCSCSQWCYISVILHLSLFLSVCDTKAPLQLRLQPVLSSTLVCFCLSD